MDAKTLLTRSITLLYNEAKTREVDARSIDLVKNALSSVIIPEVSEGAQGRDTIVELKKIASTMAESEDSRPFDRQSFLQGLKMALGSDETTYEAIQIGIENTGNESDDLRGIESIRHELMDHQKSVLIKERVGKLYHAAHFGTGPAVGSLEFITNLSREISEIAERSGASKRGVVDEVFINDEAKTAEVLQRAKDKLSPEGAIRFGQQGFNDAFYDHPGMLRGEQWCHAADSHQFKSGHGLTFYADSMIYNDPYLIDKKKKPMVVHLSTENDAEQNTVMLYEMLRSRETGEEVKIKDVDVEVAAAYVNKILSARGWTPYLCRVDSSEAGLSEAFAVLDDLQAEGYEIALLVFDYPDTLLKKVTAGMSQGPMGAEKRDMARRLRNYCKKRLIANIFYHQLGPKAKEHLRMKPKDFVKDCANKNWHDGCSTMYQEIDISSYQHMEKVTVGGKEVTYMTVQFDKHRKPKRTPHSYWYFAFPMDPHCGFRPDVDDEKPNYVRDMGPIRDQAGGDWYSDSQSQSMGF